MATRKVNSNERFLDKPVRRVNLNAMNVGETVICGPFHRSENLNGPSGLIGANINKLESKGQGKWAMRRAIIVDPITCQSEEVFLVTRISGNARQDINSVVDNATSQEYKIPFECF